MFNAYPVNLLFNRKPLKMYKSNLDVEKVEKRIEELSDELYEKREEHMKFWNFFRKIFFMKKMDHVEAHYILTHPSDSFDMLNDYNLANSKLEEYIERIETGNMEKIDFA
jgi:hypothetical protein